MHGLLQNLITSILTVILLASCSHYVYAICEGGILEDTLWPNTTAGQNASADCPVGIGEAYRACSKVESEWQTIDYTHCTLEVLENLKQQMLNASGLIDELLQIADELLTVTSYNITLSGHMAASLDLLQDLMRKPILDNAKFDMAQALVQSIVHSSGNLLDFKHDALWENIFQFQDDRRCGTFIHAIEQYGKEITSYLSRISQTPITTITCDASDNLKAKYVVTSGDRDLKYDFSFQHWVAGVTLPRTVFKEKDDFEHVGVAIIAFNETVTNWMSTFVKSPRHTHDAHVHSHVMSCSFFPAQPDPGNPPVSMEFALTKTINNNTCSNINVSSSIWRQEGITTANINSTYAKCLTSKLSGTFFAVVEVGSYRTQLPAVVTTALALALILFFSTFIILLYANRRFESDRATLVLFFLLTLIAGHLTMVSGLYATDNHNACRVVALHLHFSQLSYSFWMLGQVVQLMLKVTYKTTETGGVAQYCALGWITPSFVVASSAGLQWQYYGIEKFCTLPLDNEVSVAFIIPNLLIAGTTLICLLCATRGYYRIKKKERKLMHRMRRILPNLRACLVVLPTLVITWSIGAMAIHLEETALDIIWALVLITCSVCIFLLYGVFSSEVQNEYEIRYGPCCGKKHGAVQDSPRPGWRDEISQLSQIREPSSIGRDADSTTTNGALPGTSGLQVPMETEDLGPWSREPVNDSTASLSSTVASSLALKTKLKVFPLRKTQDQSPRRTIQETLT